MLLGLAYTRNSNPSLPAKVRPQVLSKLVHPIGTNQFQKNPEMLYPDGVAPPQSRLLGSLKLLEKSPQARSRTILGARRRWRRKKGTLPPDPGYQPIKEEEKKPPGPDHPLSSRGRSRSRERKRGHTHQPKLVDRKGVQALNRSNPGRRRRAGRKHQRLYRLLDDPFP